MHFMLIYVDCNCFLQDFVNMGFLRADKVDEVRRSGMLEPLTYMLEQLAEGGGPKKVSSRRISQCEYLFTC